MIDMDLNGLMDPLLLTRIGIKENLIMLRLVLALAVTKAASQWDGDILMNEDFNGAILCVITGNRCTFANEVNNII